ncbi:helix-turn-helix domain-containing protein [Bordetella sp. 02P26C-1]|uniref:helix-turn-helix domain-containing protein n=1 Tax=Bordetella sp. 02P26C-1 TaxID=2683195 RepID=UPI001F3CDF1E|nr:cupin domain-containing protein [Bordetella sp. 02P26C-1]
MASSRDADKQRSFSKEAMGARLRAIRKEKGFTLKQLSQASGVALSTLSKAELGQTALSYEKFVAIALALDVDMSVLLQPDGEQPSNRLNGKVIKASMQDQHDYQTATYRHQFFFSEISGKVMTPIVATVFSRSVDEFSEYIRHPGQEFAYVLSGAIRLVFENGEEIRLKRDEAAYFDSSVGHVYLSTSKTPARVLAVCTDVPERGVDVGQRTPVARRRKARSI